MECRSDERSRVGALVDWFDERPIPPRGCHACTALIFGLASGLVDDLGQRHFDHGTFLGVQLPRLRQFWFGEDVREYRAYKARGEVSEWRAARDLYEYGWRWVWWIPAMPYGEYVYELDGCPWQDAEGVDHRPEWFAACVES